MGSYIKNLSCMLLFALTLSCLGCSREGNNNKLVSIILDQSKPTEERESAIEDLRKRNAWQSLAATLPPNGKYDGVSLSAIEAISAIGNSDAIPSLEKVKNTDELVPGEFWAGLSIAIEQLKANKDKTMKSGALNENDLGKTELGDVTAILELGMQ